MKRGVTLLLLLVSFFIPTLGETKRLQRHEFSENQLVEGLNKKAANRSTVNARKRRGARERLYRRIISFDIQRKETLRETRYSQ